MISLQFIDTLIYVLRLNHFSTRKVSLLILLMISIRTCELSLYGCTVCSMNWNMWKINMPNLLVVSVNISKYILCCFMVHLMFVHRSWVCLKFYAEISCLFQCFNFSITRSAKYWQMYQGNVMFHVNLISVKDQMFSPILDLKSLAIILPRARARQISFR